MCIIQHDYYDEHPCPVLTRQPSPQPSPGSAFTAVTGEGARQRGEGIGHE